MSNTRLVVLVMLLGTFAFGQGKQPPVFKVSGKVQGYLPPEAVTLELLGGIHRTDPSRTLFDVKTGEFAILNVAPGEYRLRARQEKMRGEVKVSIGSTDVSGLSIALLLPRTVLGAMRSVGGEPETTFGGLAMQEALALATWSNRPISFSGLTDFKLMIAASRKGTSSSGALVILALSWSTVSEGIETP